MHKLLKYVVAAGLALVAVLLLLLSKDEGAQGPLATTQGPLATTQGPLATAEEPLHDLRSVTLTPRAPAHSVPPSFDEELDQEEQAALADCWSRCGSPCISGESGACPSECESDNECQADELCMPTRMTVEGVRYQRCLFDQCSAIGADSDCGPNMTCNFISRLEGSIYMCTQAGRRTTGEPCGHAEFDDIGLCDVGLHCLNGECSPLSCEVDNDCGNTARCFGFAGGIRQCVPFCETDSDCPDDKVCNKEREIGHCVAPETMGCLRMECDEGSECVVHNTAAYLSVTSCLHTCSSSSECAKGQACGNTNDLLKPYCYQRCDQNTPCKEGWRCGEPGQVSLDDDSSPAMCVRDITGAIDSFFQDHDKE